MRLGLILYGSPDSLSGGYLYDRKLVEHLRRCGDRVEIISLPWRNYARHLADNFSPALVRRLQAEKYDTILQDELNHPSLFWLNRSLKGSAPILSIVHHLRCSEQRPAWQNFVYALIEKWYLHSVDGFIFNSQTTLAAVAGLTSIHRPSTLAYPAGNRLGPPLDPRRIRERAARPGPLSVLFVGNLIRRKGLETLLDALARLPEGWELNVVGSLAANPAYAARIQQRLARHFSTRVRLHGALSDSRLAEQFSSNHVLIVPSTYEGFGIVYLEGMGFGLPAIATTSGGAWEIITHGQNGFLVAPNEPAALARCIQTLSHDRAQLSRMSLAARERFLAHPTWEQSMRAVRAFIQAMVSQPKGGLAIS